MQINQEQKAKIKKYLDENESKIKNIQNELKNTTGNITF